MSSIYRKGRDGLFYYQSYLNNPETGKKDKRVYHALNTRSRNEAQLKKIELDKKYSDPVKNMLLDRFPKRKKLFKITLVFFFLLYLASKISSEKVTIPNSMVYQDKIYSHEAVTDNDTSFALKLNSIKEDVVPDFEINTDINDTLIPDYKIMKIKKLSQSFNQAEIHIVIKKEAGENALIKLCDYLREEYEMFKNLILCIYLDSENILEFNLANRDLNLDEGRFSLIAMYTFNPVEGAFFNGDLDIKQKEL